jgi:hypothetical protein
MGSVNTGYLNTALGDSALSCVEGNFNVAIGYSAMATGTSGDLNTAVGTCSGFCLSGFNNVLLGYCSGADSLCTLTNQDNHIILGNTASSIIVARVGTITAPSDVRIKKVHGEVPLALDFVESLTPIKYQFCDPETGKVNDDRYRYGFSAQEVIENEEYPDHPIIGNNSNPDRLALGGDQMIPVLVNAIKELSAEVKALKAQISGG